MFLNSELVDLVPNMTERPEYYRDNKLGEQLVHSIHGIPSPQQKDLKNNPLEQVVLQLHPTIYIPSYQR